MGGLRTVLALVAVVITLVAGCASTIPGSPQAMPGSGQPSSSASPSGSAQAVANEIKDAEQVVNQYWTAHWAQFFTGSYRPPQVVGLYDGRSPDAPLCGDKKAPPMNALYCRPGDFVAWDVQLMTRGYQVGDAWVYLVVAHEWGHAIQARIAQSLNSLASELQADCLAGATLYGSVQDGTLTFEEGDVKEIATALTVVSDETPWTSVADHGDPFERIGAFDQGRRGGVPACLPGAVR